MIYTDGTHLVSSTSLQELHTFAQSIGLKRCWFQDHSRHPHYDLTTNRKAYYALKQGAKLVTSRQIVTICNKSAQKRPF